MNDKSLSFLLSFLLVTYLLVHATPTVKAGSIYSYKLEFQWGDEGDTGSNSLRDEHPSDSADLSADGFTVTTTDSFTLGYITRRMERVGFPTGNLTAVVYAESGSKPTGNPLVYSTPVNSSTVPDSISWVTFNFTAANYTLSATTTYCFSMEANTSNVDALNYVKMWYTTNTTANSDRFNYKNGGWVGPLSASYDSHFYVYSVSEAAKVYLTTYHTSGGIIRRDNVTLANGTQNEFYNDTSIAYEYIALVEGNNTYTFSNWTYNGNSNISNPYDFNMTILGNTSVWCYFEEATTTSMVGVQKLWTGLILVALFIGVPMLLMSRKKWRLE